MGLWPAALIGLRRCTALVTARFYAYVYRRLAPEVEEVSDTVAEVFSVAWRRLDDAPEGDRELVWLYGVAHRCVLRTRRSGRRRLRLAARLRAEARTGPANHAPVSGEPEVRDAIRRLPAGEREALRLVMWEGLSHSEAAQVLGCSPNAVTQRLRSARNRLRAALKEPALDSSEMTTTG